MPLGLTKRGPAVMAAIGVCDDGEVALFDGLPVLVNGVISGTEVGATGGYARQPVSAADWSLDLSEATVTLEFGPATEAWDLSPRWWVWRDGDDVVQAWGQLRRPVLVEDAVSSVPVELVINIVDNSGSEE